jgi:ribosomal protein S18 acetylase RimI-like enzyme
MDINKIKEQIKADPEYAFRELSEELRDNEEIVLYALSVYHINLFYANKRFIKDEDFMLRAMKVNFAALEFADESLYYTREFILKAITVAPEAFFLVPDEFYQDKEIREKAGDEVRFVDEL